MVNLAHYGRVRVWADRLGLETIDREGPVVVYKFRQKTKVDLPRLVNLVRERPELQLIPPGSLKQDLKRDEAPPSRRPKPAWWTARATAGEVTAGFSKAEITRAAPTDARSDGGLLERVLGVLEALSDD